MAHPVVKAVLTVLYELDEPDGEPGQQLVWRQMLQEALDRDDGSQAVEPLRDEARNVMSVIDDPELDLDDPDQALNVMAGIGEAMDDLDAAGQQELVAAALELSEEARQAGDMARAERFQLMAGV